MAYQVTTIAKKTVVSDADIRVFVSEKQGKVEQLQPYCQATLYSIKGGFIPEKVFVFQTESYDLDALKKVVDFYFTTLMETELYVKEVPQDSALFAQQATRLFGINGEEMKDGAVSVICNGWAK